MRFIRNCLHGPKKDCSALLQPGQMLQGVVVLCTTGTWRDSSLCAGAAVPIGPSYGTAAASAGSTWGEKPRAGISPGRASVNPAADCVKPNFSTALVNLQASTVPRQFPRPRASGPISRFVADCTHATRSRSRTPTTPMWQQKAKAFARESAKAFLVRVRMSFSFCLRGPLPRRRCPSQVPSGS